MDQFDMFGNGAPQRRTPVMPDNSGVVGAHHPVTSIEAAEKVDARTGRQRIENFLLGCRSYGATCDEIEVALNMAHSTTSGRLYELRGAYHAYKGPTVVVATSEKRRTRSGCNARVNVHIEYLDGVEVKP